MAAKRLHEDGNQSQDDDQAKRLKKQISFSSSPPQRQIQVMEPSNLKLIFKKPPSLPIYTSTKIEGEDGQCLQIQLVDTRTGEPPAACRLLSNLKVELVAINGDFPGDKEEWSPSDFNNNIERERLGRRPLLIGEVSVTLRDGVVSIGDLSFTDNSSWIRSRHFRIGARVVPESYDGPRIIEALTERFTVKDQRGELYKKHYPPALGDEVWRLERIGKGGTFHSKLAAEKIETVQDFLKLLVIDPNHLRSILGLSMSDKMWVGTISHARTCPLGTKQYWFHGPDCAIILNPICEVVSVIIDGNFCSPDQLPVQQRAYVQLMAKEAYLNWHNLKETDTLLPMQPAPQGLIPSSSWHPANQEMTASHEFQVEGSPDESQLFDGFDALFGSKSHPHN
ncbi:hypothetical protein J5N97_007540 [Dioscorea zingiberensis]|uniref:Uncharacterized protein n=1 Tax=Dioscorea zingiberensis TaxID=325984 RepID=A0A9D5DDE0_9LILI|nr:hypothetical protein J5N97_007540 [Dioscorea zingiberensis]